MLQKILRFKFPLWEMAKGTNTQAWLVPKIDSDKLKYS